MGANLRYIALRKRFAVIFSEAVTTPYGRIIDELYRSLPHYTAIAIFAVTTEGLALQASHSITGEQARQMAAGLAAEAATSGKPLLVPDITRDTRARPLSDAIVAELAVPVLSNNVPVFVIDVQSDRYASLGRADQELLTWLAHALPVQAAGA